MYERVNIESNGSVSIRSVGMSRKRKRKVVNREKEKYWIEREKKNNREKE